jgi:hypothetical protein
MKMKSILLIALVASTVLASLVGASSPVLPYPSPQKYCGTFDSGDASGIKGVFGMKIDSQTGTGTYGWSLDLNGYTQATSEGYDINSPLKWHIHTYWTDTSKTSASLTGCGASNTGGHYDPTLACGTASQYQSYPTTNTTYCKALGRTADDGYVYPCGTPSNYFDGEFSNCEVGDLSGKFGFIVPENGIGIAANEYVVVDPVPPYKDNYFNMGKEALSMPWASIVFHKQNGDRFFCAKFVLDNTGNTACDNAGVFGPDPSGDGPCPEIASTDTYTKEDVQKWVIISIILTIIVNVVLYFLCGFLDFITCRNRTKKVIVKKGGKGDRVELRSNMHTAGSNIA